MVTSKLSGEILQYFDIAEGYGNESKGETTIWSSVDDMTTSLTQEFLGLWVGPISFQRHFGYFFWLLAAGIKKGNFLSDQLSDGQCSGVPFGAPYIRRVMSPTPALLINSRS
ncbi:hypothetical protein BBP40_005390 [Aspergillus hancockii]|nr:hypothetical protein BBP40_005390 [Aspergillus hancockii]